MLQDLLAQIRTLYGEVEEYPQKATQLRLLAEQLPTTSEILRLAYQAAGEALKARETWLPWEKLAHFQKAMHLFEDALLQNPNQIEVRFLRYTIQSNTPSILGMGVNMLEDKQLILQHITTDATDDYMKASIAKHLLKHAPLTIKEKKIAEQYIAHYHAR